MKKKKLRKSKEIIRKKLKLKEKFPQAADVNIKIDKNDQGDFESMIRVHIPPRKRLLAFKTDKSFSGSLDKSYQAIIRQVQKVKSKWKRRATSPLEYEFSV